MSDDFLKTLDDWLSKAENIKLHHDILEGLNLLPHTIAVTLCSTWLEMRGYEVKEKK